MQASASASPSAIASTEDVGRVVTKKARPAVAFEDALDISEERFGSGVGFPEEAASPSLVAAPSFFFLLSSSSSFIFSRSLSSFCTVRERKACERLECSCTLLEEIVLSSVAAWTQTCRAILNLHETYTRE